MIVCSSPLVRFQIQICPGWHKCCPAVASASSSQFEFAAANGPRVRSRPQIIIATTMRSRSLDKTCAIPGRLGFKIERSESTLAGWSLSRVKLDLLHVLYLGFAQDLMGSMLIIFAESLFPAINCVVALKELFVDFRGWCRMKRICFTMKPFNLKTICFQSPSDPSYPRLTSRIKGAKVRTLIKWAAHVARRLRFRDGPSENRYLMMSSLVEFIEVIVTLQHGLFRVRVR